MKRRSFLTTAFAALGLGRVAANASEPTPVIGVDPASGKDKSAVSLCKAENGRVSHIRTIIADMKKSDTHGDHMRARIQALHKIHSTP